MIKVKLKYLLNSQGALTGLLNMPIKTKSHFDLSKILKRIRDEVETFQETYNKKVKEDGIEKTDAHGKPTGGYDIKPELFEAFNEEIKKITDEEIEVHGHAVPYNDLGIKDADDKMDKYAGLGNHLSYLDWLITG